MPKLTKRISPLAEAVAGSFEAAGYSPEDLLQGQVAVTDMTWQAPPLKFTGLLLGLPFHTYLDYPLGVNSEKLYELYVWALPRIHAQLEHISGEDGYYGLSKTMPLVTAGERNLALPLPEGWPVGSHTAGPVFAMEVARIFQTSGKCHGFVETADSYYAETEWGKVGLVDGYVSIQRETWNISCAGFVSGLLEQPRGRISTACHYDIIARLRSVLHLDPTVFREFEAIDYGLQALRILSDGDTCKDLLRAVEGMRADGFKRRAKIKAVELAVETMESWHLQDRAKISILQEVLVPDVLKFSEFSRKVYNPTRIIPDVLSKKEEARIQTYLKNLLAKVKPREPLP